MTIQSFRDWLVHALVPFTQWFGNLHLPGTEKLITEKDGEAVRGLVRPGMVILTHMIGAAGSNTLLAGDFWKHAAIVASDCDSVMEATAKGVIHTSLDYFLYSKDYAVLLMPRFASIVEMAAAAKWAESQVGKPYDYEFKDGWDAFYCSELATDAYMVATNSTSPFMRHNILGVNTVKPQDFRNAKEKWTEVYLSEAARGISDAA